MRAAVEAIDLGKQFPRKQVGQNVFRRMFGRRKGADRAERSDHVDADRIRTDDVAAASEEAVEALSSGEQDGIDAIRRNGDPTAARNDDSAGDTIVAVKGVSFAVRPGEVFGFLGPNGAGKTTTIRMLATLLEPTTGHAYICGHDVGREAMEARAKLGAVLAGDRSLYWKLSGRENLEFFATLYRVPTREIPKRVETVLKRMQLDQRADEMVERYSTGMKQRLALARALLADPPVLLLDEPTLGLDPQSARNLRDIVLELKDEGRAILLTTHYMEEADLLSDRIAIIDHGQIIALDTPEKLKNDLSGERLYRLELVPANGNGALGANDTNGTNGTSGANGPNDTNGTNGTSGSNDTKGVFQAIAERVPGLTIVEQRPDAETGSVHVTFTLANPKEETSQVWTALAASETNVLNYAVEEPTLEDVFISLTGRGLRD